MSASHRLDSDCLGHIDELTGDCLICGAVSGDPCPECGGLRYHEVMCSEWSDFGAFSEQDASDRDGGDR